MPDEQLDSTTPDPLSEAEVDQTDPTPAPLDFEAAFAQAKAAYDDQVDGALEPGDPDDDAARESGGSPTSDDDASEPTEQADDSKPLTRRGAGDLIKTTLAQLEQERVESARLRQEATTRETDDSRAIAELRAEIGSDEELEQLTQAGLDGDWDAAEKAKAMKSTRAFYTRAVRVARLQEWAKMGSDFEQAKSLPGVDQAVLSTSDSIYAAMQHVHAAAVRVTEATYKTQLERERETHKAGLARAASRGLPSPEVGGRSTGGGRTPAPSWRGPDGLPTDEAMELVRQGRLNPSTFGQ